VLYGYNLIHLRRFSKALFSLVSTQGLETEQPPRQVGVFGETAGCLGHEAHRPNDRLVTQGCVIEIAGAGPIS
jgi:hypothetical protein